MADNLYAEMTTAPEPAAKPAPAAASAAPKWWKYTVSLPPETRLALSADVMRLAQATGLAVDRRHVTLALYQALHDDETLFADVARRMPRLVEELASRRDG